MGELVRFELSDEGYFLVEPGDEDSEGLEEIAADGGTVIRRAQERFGDALDGIRSMAAEARERINAMDVAPKRLELEFGVKLSGETGAFVAKTAGEAHLVVRAVWEQGADTP
ncbi:CU044_2847 family protein [Streptomyces sp. NPDC050400]|uniref:CU044_2847 family protein n=1 Tax=Streptomyces sp. NPDC050400 TaxID=3365610 RepID=UPI003795936C